MTEGGIGSLVVETMADSGVGKRFARPWSKDTYTHGGSRENLMHHCRLDALALVRGIDDLCSAEFGITEEDLDPVRQG